MLGRSLDNCRLNGSKDSSSLELVGFDTITSFMDGFIKVGESDSITLLSFHHTIGISDFQHRSRKP